MQISEGAGSLNKKHDGSETVGDSFSYTIQDASGATSNVAGVTLTVTPVNDAPTAVDDSATVNEGVARMIVLEGKESDPDYCRNLRQMSME